ncbi:uncharacterized protein LOC126284051 isoform X1 [Schistocerca gregaria]|uniref:uncharacterized protein LOC126284051 isoform X1 n=1 Tax=Schistocerca gregaria TaxID=7010 RepID=UPI00211EF463|nr:uncharacterized protein LOC126284051 isoform X1 [Schistocerca gregaria]
MTTGPLPLLTAGLLVAVYAAAAGALQLRRLSVPQYKVRGDMALLQCLYDLEDDALYSVKWYKDDEEFYRYVPRSHPPQHSYKIDGVKVDNQLSDDKQVVLRSVNLKSTGEYRCEVSAEAPSFASAQQEAHMEVVCEYPGRSALSPLNAAELPPAVGNSSQQLYNTCVSPALPKDGPHIFGEERLYQVGDEISLNCTSGRSYPASVIKWFINDKEVPGDDPRLEAHPPQRHAHGLVSSSLGLRFAVSGAHFVSGSMKLRCVAEVAPVLWQGDSESVVQRVTPPPNTVREALFLVRGTSNLNSGSAVIVALMSYFVVAVGT